MEWVRPPDERLSRHGSSLDPASDLIFSIPKLISFLSKGTTLRPGTLILTG